jgi:hypothetical protein
MTFTEIFITVSLILLLLLLALLLIFSIWLKVKYRKQRNELETRIEESDRERHEFREFIKTVFNPFIAIEEYLDKKVVILSQTEYFTYSKDNPKYKISLRSNSLLGVYNSKNDIYYLVCEIDNKEIIVQAIAEEYEVEDNK